jgi:hypothetical protein
MSQTPTIGALGKGVVKIIIVKSMEFQALIKFLPVSRFMLGSLHFITTQLGDLMMQEPELPKIQGSDFDWIPLTQAQDHQAPAPQSELESNTLGES